MCSQLVSLLASGQAGLLQSLKSPRFATHLRRHLPLANQLAEPSDQIESKLHIGRILDRSLQDAELPHNSGGVVLLRILPMEVLRVVETGYGRLFWFESPPGGLTGKIVLDRIVGAKTHVVVDVGNAGIIEDLLGRGNSRLEVALDERRFSWPRTLRHAAPPRGAPRREGRGRERRGPLCSPLGISQRLARARSLAYAARTIPPTGTVYNSSVSPEGRNTRRPCRA